MAQYNENYPEFMKEPSNSLFEMPIYVDYNYPTTGTGVKETSMFSGLTENLSVAGDYVWDGVEGIWVHAKEGISSIGESLSDASDSLMMRIVKYLAIGLVGLLLVIWVLGKSGVSGDIAKGASAFFGAGR